MTTKKRSPKMIAMFSLKRYLASQLAKKIKKWQDRQDKHQASWAGHQTEDEHHHA
jgi:hypothetical protein